MMTNVACPHDYGTSCIHVQENMMPIACVHTCSVTDMNDVGMNMQNRRLIEESVCMNSSLK